MRKVIIYTFILIVMLVGITTVIFWLGSLDFDLIGEARRNMPAYDEKKVRCFFGGCQKIPIPNRQLEKVIIPEGWVTPDKVSLLKNSGEECEAHEECISKTCTKPIDQLMDSGPKKYCAYLSEEVAYWLQAGEQTQAGNYIINNINNIQTQGKTHEEALKSISKWIQNYIMDDVDLTNSEKGAYTANEYVSNQFDAEGCTDFGVIFAAFARAKGFPTILVETYQLAYLQELEQGNKPFDIFGHFFVNVYFNGEWHVYNPNDYDGIGGIGTFLTPIYNPNCHEDESLPGPEGCYNSIIDKEQSWEHNTFVVTNKGLDFWDMYEKGSCVDDANTELLDIYGLN
jgi:predicted RNase H-like HicB family nuclease